MQTSAQVLDSIIAQHATEINFLWLQRRSAIRSPVFSMRELSRLDERLAAHIDGLRIAGETGLRAATAQLGAAELGGMFAVTVLALELRQTSFIDRLLAFAEADPEMQAGLISAFGWTGPTHLRGTVSGLLNSQDDFKRLVGVAACAAHRVDPGIVTARRFADCNDAVRARVLRAAGEIGQHELVSTCARGVDDEDTQCRFWAAWSAVLLGDRQNGLEILTHIGRTPGPLRLRAFQLAIQAMSAPAAHALLRSLAQEPEDLHFLIRGAGLGGDPAYVPWLIGLMADDKLTRLSGESLSLMTGVNLDSLNLERKRPENFESVPNDDPDDPNIITDEDDGLPWPDQKLIQAWWNANSHRFQPGVRYFMGEPLNRENCLRVLKEGYQRQRIAAALFLSLLNPGTALFEWRAPAWRQQRLLASMT